jgi:endonuclease/exonuclease/phosphatase (EEP) superfamily protein YafD
VRRAVAATLTAAAVLLVLAGVVVLQAPDRLGLAGTEPFLQLVALRGSLAAGLALAAVLLLGLAGALLRVDRRAGVPARRAVPLVVGCGVLLLLGAGGQVAVLAGRGLDASGPGDPDDADLVVLAFNTLDAVSADDLATLVTAQDADVVVLPETSGATARAVARELTAAGRPTTALAADAGGTRVQGTALLLRAGLGDYTQVTDGVPATELGTFAAVRAGDGVGEAGVAGEPGPGPATVLAVHTRAPSARASLPDWRAHTTDVAATCRSTPGIVVAGDLNTTLDHPALTDLGPCVDAAAEAGAAGLGTWPSGWPAALGAPIDHVLVDARVWRVVGFAVLPDVGASDHRPVVAHLARR